jgi:anti-sigma factor RsiW
MKSVERPVTEDDLHAFVDGFLAPEERARVEHYLGAHPDAAARVAAWQDSTAMLRRVFNAKAQENLPGSLDLRRLAQARLERRWAPRQMAAGVALALCLGAGAGWFAHGSDPTRGLAGLGAQAAIAQRVFAADATHPVEFGPGELKVRVGWAGENDRPVKAPDLSSAGYRLLGGRRVATEQGSACMFIYADAQGNRISVFVRLMVGYDTNAPVRPLEASGVSGYAWSRDGIGYGLVSTANSPSLRALSDQVRAQMSTGT